VTLHLGWVTAKGTKPQGRPLMATAPLFFSYRPTHRIIIHPGLHRPVSLLGPCSCCKAAGHLSGFLVTLRVRLSLHNTHGQWRRRRSWYDKCRDSPLCLYLGTYKT